MGCAGFCACRRPPPISTRAALKNFKPRLPRKNVRILSPCFAWKQTCDFFRSPRPWAARVLISPAVFLVSQLGDWRRSLSRRVEKRQFLRLGAHLVAYCLDRQFHVQFRAGSSLFTVQ